MSGERDTCEYIAVGSGAGGGTVAARLAEAGMHVILLEAGGDPRQTNVAGLPDKDFKVHGTHALRVVDASVFPRIPGFSSVRST